MIAQLDNALAEAAGLEHGPPPPRVAPGRVTVTSRMAPSTAALAAAMRGDVGRVALAAPVQREARAQALDDPFAVHLAAQRGVASGGGALPHLPAIQRSFGHHDVSGVAAHVGGAAATAAEAIGAAAYATGDHVAFAAAPDLRQAAHEAAHVVQQRGGVRLDGGVGRAGDPYEQHADLVAERVVRGESAEALLDTMAHRGAAGGPAVQRWQRIGEEQYHPAVRPLFGPDQIRRISVDVGTEAEWRAALADADENAYLISFLRAAYVPAAGFAAHASEHMADHPTLRLSTLAPALPLRPRRELTRVPTHEERMRLAKAMYMRREWGMHAHQTEGLLPQLVDECQADLLDLVARGGHTITPGEAGRAAELAGRDGTEHMIASGAGSLIDALGRFLATDDDHQRLECDALIRQAGYTLRGAIETLEADYAAERDAIATTVDGIVATVLGNIPGAIPRLLRVPARAIAAAVVDAMVTPAPARARLERIHRAATELVNGFDYAGAGIDDATRLAEQPALRSAIDSSLM